MSSFAYHRATSVGKKARHDINTQDEKGATGRHFLFLHTLDTGARQVFPVVRDSRQLYLSASKETGKRCPLRNVPEHPGLSVLVIMVVSLLEGSSRFVGTKESCPTKQSYTNVCMATWGPSKTKKK